MITDMSGRRSYGDRCGISRALDLVGERWALLIVRELVLGPKRFSDLRAGLPHVSADVLSQRLRELEQAGVLTRRTLPPPAGARVYELTPWGAELEPVVLALGRWGSRAPFPPDADSFGPDSAMLALKTVFSPSAATGLTAVYGVRLRDQPFVAEVADGRLRVTRGEPARPPAAEIATDPDTLAAVLWHGAGLDGAIAAGDVTLTGERAAAERFLALFPAPIAA
jgi:DNA-binding HxlR family transcriptional regulator